jgi:ABC-type proline/glycine betaine transport system permease subunit
VSFYLTWKAHQTPLHSALFLPPSGFPGYPAIFMAILKCLRRMVNNAKVALTAVTNFIKNKGVLMNITDAVSLSIDI